MNLDDIHPARTASAGPTAGARQVNGRATFAPHTLQAAAAGDNADRDNSRVSPRTRYESLSTSPADAQAQPDPGLSSPSPWCSGKIYGTAPRIVAAAQGRVLAETRAISAYALGDASAPLVVTRANQPLAWRVFRNVIPQDRTRARCWDTKPNTWAKAELVRESKSKYKSGREASHRHRRAASLVTTAKGRNPRGDRLI